MWYELLQRCYMVACLALAGVVIDRTHKCTLSRNVISIVLLAAIHLAQHGIPMPALAFAALEFAWYGIIFTWCIMAIIAKTAPEPEPAPPVVFRLERYESGEDVDVYYSSDTATPPRQ